MNEQEQMSQLSALFDNELPPAEAELVIRRVLKDPALRARWERYSLIGACVRGEPVRVSASVPDVAERVRMRLDMEAERPQMAEQSIVRYPGQRSGWSQLARGALGGSIAAGVAALALVVVNSMSPEAAGQVVQMADAVAPTAVSAESQAVQVSPPAQAPVQVAAADPPRSITTPVGGSAARNAVNHVVTHSAVAASAGRLLPLSAAMNGSYDIIQGTVPMTDDEIRKYR